MDDIHQGLDLSYSLEGRLLAFDFGYRYIGVAVGQTITCTASALGIIEALGEEPNWEVIASYVRQWNPVALVVGFPLDMKDNLTPITLAARNFALELKKRFQKPVFLMDERLTSNAAKERLKEAGVYKKNPRQRLDAVSAQIILESWLHEYGAKD